MTPEVILRELGHIAIGDILLETTDGQATGPASGCPAHGRAGANSGGLGTEDT